MRNSKYRISFTVVGEQNLGTVIAALAGEVSDIQITELERESGAPRSRSSIVNNRASWVKKYVSIVLSCIPPQTELHYKQIGERVEKATSGTVKQGSITPLLTELVRGGYLVRTGERGMYKVA